MPPEKIDKRGPRLCGDNKEKGPSTNISIHSVAIYQFDMTARGGFSFVIDLQNISAPTCCGIGDSVLVRQTGYQLFAFPRAIWNQRLSTVELDLVLLGSFLRKATKQILSALVGVRRKFNWKHILVHDSIRYWIRQESRWAIIFAF
jgi:hypothetical protein